MSIETTGRRVLRTAALLLALTACGAGAEQGTDPGRAIEVAQAERDDVVRHVTAVGRVEASRQARVSAELPERIEAVHVELGEEVAKGDPIVTLSGVAQAAGLGQAQGALEAARASLDLARSQAERVRVLHQAGTVSRADLEAAESQLRSSEAQVRQLGQARTQAAVQSARTVVRAPFDGVVAFVDADPGDIAQPGAPLAVVVQPGPMRVELDVPERDLHPIRVGQPVTLWALADPDRVVSGSVSAVGRLVDATTRTGRVHVQVPGGGELLAGSAVRTAIETERRSGAVLVPVAAVQLAADYQESRRATVFQVREGVATAREVVLGERVGDRFEVVEGLEPDTTIATLGAHLLRDGAPVRVVGGGQ